jgi:hypothetical protein
MTDALRMVNQGMPKNPGVRILPRDKNGICITPLDAQPDPENLKGLPLLQKQAEIQANANCVFQTAAHAIPGISRVMKGDDS